MESSRLRPICTVARSLKIPMARAKRRRPLTKDQVKAVLDATADYALRKFPRAMARLLCADFVGAGDGRLRTRMKIQN